MTPRTKNILLNTGLVAMFIVPVPAVLLLTSMLPTPEVTWTRLTPYQEAALHPTPSNVVYGFGFWAWTCGMILFCLLIPLVRWYLRFIVWLSQEHPMWFGAFLAFARHR